MGEQALSKASIEVKRLRIVLITLLLLYGAVFIGATLYIAGTFRAFLHSDPFHSFFWTEIRVLLDRVLTGPICFFIGYSIFKLIVLASHGEPYSRQSPRHLRRIAFSIFGLGLIGAITSAIVALTQPFVILSDVIVQILYGNLGTVLLGFGFLVIAKVIEVGVRLQQDQNLTI